MQNKTSVLNTALVRVGAQMGNAGFQGTPAMQVAGAVYDKCRTLCLSLYPWPFALPSGSVRVVGATGASVCTPGM